jgi:hypothetical protein
MAKRVVVALLCLCVISVASAQSEFEPEHPRLLVYGCETGAGLGAAALTPVVTLVGMAVVTFPIAFVMLVTNFNDEDLEPFPPDWVVSAAAIAGVALAPAVSGLTVARVGRGFDDVRSTPAAIIGSYCGTATCIGASCLFWPKNEDGSAAFSPGDAWPEYLMVAAGTALGATIGYNVSRARPMETGSFGSRVGMPSVALTSVELENGTAAYGADLRLLTVRF